MQTGAQGDVTAFGLSFGEAALTKLGSAPAEIVLALPPAANLRVRTAVIDWSPQGHPPAHVYDVPHPAYGALPVVQPNGNVVITTEDSNGYDGTAQNIISFVSTDGGKTVSAAYEISPISAHTVTGSMRTQSLPTTAVDAYGTVYTVWQDCRFRSGCSSNDLVLSASRNALVMEQPGAYPARPRHEQRRSFLTVARGADIVFGTTFGLSYYEFPQADCTVSTCALYAAFSASGNRSTWSTPLPLAGPMSLTNLALIDVGYMVGDYFTSVIPSGYVAPLAVGVTPSAYAYNEAIYLPYSDRSSALPTARGASSALGGADSAALHGGAVKPVFRAARPAPRTLIHRSRHPM